MKRLSFSTLFGCIIATAVIAAEIPADVQSALKEVSRYDHSQPRAPLFMLEQFVAHSAGTPQGGDVAAMLAGVLASPESSFVAKVIMCQQLAKVGTDAQVPMLAKLLEDAQLSDPARFALEAMRSAAADTALRESLSRLSGKPLVGVINSLGNRCDIASLPRLQELLSNSDRDVAIASARALGSLGTREAAAALAKSDDAAAKLLCAQRLARTGLGSMAVGICRGLVTAGNPPDQRVAALTILADANALDSENYVIRTISDSDSFVSANAIRLSVKLKGAKVTAILAEELKKQDAQRQVLILNAMADRHDSAALAAVEETLHSSNEDVRVAALTTLGAIGSAGSVKLLAEAMVNEKGRVKAAAEEAMSVLPGGDVDLAISQGLSSGPASMRAVMINVAVARNLTGAIPSLLQALTGKDRDVQLPAAQALSKIGRAEDYASLIGVLSDADDSATRDALTAAVAAVGKRISDPQARLAPLLAALKRDGVKGGATAALLRALAGIGGPEALAVLNERVNSGDVAVRDAAVRALSSWPEASAMESLLSLAERSSNSLHRTLALRGALRLAPDHAEPMKSLGRAQPLIATKEERQQLLSALSQLKSPEALDMTVGLVSQGDTKTEAALAAAQIARALVKSHPDSVDTAMTKVLAVAKDSADAKSLQEQARKLLKAKSESSHSRRDAVAKLLPAGSKLVTYLDCGIDSEDKSAGGVRMWVAHGKDYEWNGEGSEGNAAAFSVIFAGGQVVINATGLGAKKNYELGFTWWDFDDNKRDESVWVSGKQIVEKTTLPSWKGRKQGPATLTRAIPADAIRDGKIEVAFKQEGVGNCVVSEIWLVERTGGAAAASVVPAPVTATKPEPKPAAASIAAARTNPGAAKKALIVTGMEYPGHKWRETAPFLCGMISEDKRIGVEINDDAKAALESPSLGSNDVIVLNYMNWENPGPGDAAQEGLRKAVENGTGLVLVHFACGAFQTWPEFVKIAGRVWNPKFRGHDARGPFNVHIVDAQHEIMKGFKDFGTDDELYTCLDGNTAIHILADASSKVDKKDYPMAFVLQYGKGRVFLSTLGHDVKALSFPDVKNLYRRATAWAAGLEPK